MLYHGKGALKVDGYDIVPFLFGHVKDHAVAQDSLHR